MIEIQQQDAQPVHSGMATTRDERESSPAAEAVAADRRRDAHNLARTGRTRCDGCGEVYPTDECFVKRVDFRTISKRKTVRTRTAAKLCASCLEKDEQWNLPTTYN